MNLSRPLTAFAILALMAAALVIGSVPAAAATCSATDLQSGTAYSDLQAAIDAATPGDTIHIDGRCIGNFTIAKNLSLWGRAILDGNHTGTTLTITGGTVFATRLTIANGSANGSGTLANGGDISDSASLILTRSSLIGGEAFGNGGGLFVDSSGEAIIRGSTVSGNFADGGLGGGLYSTGHLRLFGSDVSSNHSSGGGAGIYSSGHLGVFFSTVQSNGEAQSSGGGIYSSGQATIKRGTIDGNYAHSNGDGIENTGTLSLTNSTLSGNGGGEGSGGGISNSGTLALTNSTVSKNTAAGGGGGIDNRGSTTLRGTIVAANTSAASAGPHCTGSLSSGGYNLVGDATGCTFSETGTDQVGPVSGHPIDPKLGALANNGGPTQTMALLAGSPAIDTIPPATCTAFLGASPTDQRGVTRPQGSGCDAGAFELQT